jgi:hypothetical protein
MYFTLFLWVLLGVQGPPRQTKPANPSSNSSDANGNPPPAVQPATVRGKVVEAESGAPIKRAQVVLRLNAVGNTTFWASPMPAVFTKSKTSILEPIPPLPASPDL